MSGEQNGNGTAMVRTEAVSVAMAPEVSYQRGLEPRNLDEVYRIASCMAKAGLAKTPEEAVVKIITGRELGFSAAQSLRLIFVVNGRPSLEASAMHALCLRSAICEVFERVSSSAAQATYRVKRKGAIAQEYTFTFEDAKQAKLQGKDNWMGYPQRMCEARAKAAAARGEFPDLVNGLFTIEEADDMSIQVEQVEAVDAHLVATAERNYEAELEALADAINAAPKASDVTARVKAFVADAGDPWAAMAKDIYNARVAALKAQAKAAETATTEPAQAE